MSNLAVIERSPDLFVAVKLSPAEAVAHVAGVIAHLTLAATETQEAGRLAWELHVNQNWKTHPGCARSTWEEFSAKAWGNSSKRNIARLIQNYDVNRNLAEVGVSCKVIAHTEALATLPTAELQQQAYITAKETATYINPRGKSQQPIVTEAHLRNVISQITDFGTDRPKVDDEHEARATEEEDTEDPFYSEPDELSLDEADYYIVEAGREKMADMIRAHEQRQSPPSPDDDDDPADYQHDTQKAPDVDIYFDPVGQHFNIEYKQQQIASMRLDEFFEQASVTSHFLAKQAELYQSKNPARTVDTVSDVAASLAARTEKIHKMKCERIATRVEEAMQLFGKPQMAVLKMVVEALRV